MLNAQGEPIADEILSVSPAQATTVRIHRRSSRFSYSCDPNCAPALEPGDNTEHYNIVKTQIESRHKMSKATATGEN